MSEDGPKAAAEPKFTHDEILAGFRQVVADVQEFYKGRLIAKHVDYPESVCRHRIQIAYAAGQIVKGSGFILSMVKTEPTEDERG
jgi:hypothetical protein